MSQVDDLIAEFCPYGVELKNLGEVGEFIRGHGLQKKDLAGEGVGAIHYGEIHTHYGTVASETKSFVAPALAAKLRRAKPGDLVIATTSEDDDAVAKAVAWEGGNEVAVSSDAYIYRHALDPRYLSYFFQSEHFQRQKRRFISGTKVRRVSGDALAKIRIAVPPRAIQQEIARVLTSIESLEGELEAELEAESEARRRQYQQYRDSLIVRTSETSPSVLLRELVGTGFFTDGDWVESKDQDPAGDVRLTQLADVGVGVFRNRSDRWMREDQAAKLGCTFLRPGDLLIARMPDPLGRTCQVPPDIGRAVTVVDVAILRSERDDSDSRYIMHAVNSRIVNERILSFQAGGTRQRISRKNLGAVRIPLPPAGEQRRIAEILDEFDPLTNDLSIGLSAELKTRRQQYVHYRDRLLTFSEAA